MRNFLRVVGLFVCVWLSYTLGALQESRRAGRNLFEGVRNVVQRYYVDPVDADSLVIAGVYGVIDHLHDPYTEIMDPRRFMHFREDAEGEFGGIGTQIQVRSEGLTIVSPHPDQPAARAGIRAGDRVVAVDGKPTEGWNREDAVAALRGEPGSDVTLTVRRGDDTLNIRVRRDTIRVSAVSAAAILEDGIGYVALDMFSANATADLRVAIDSLIKEGARALVLDLRSNPGGLLEQALAIANLFLPQGVLLAEARGRDERLNRQFWSMEQPRYPDLPLALVVNGATASAAEIVAGALRDHHRARIFGTRTFGKGSIQTLFPLPQDYVMQLTTARWFTPSGDSFDNERNTRGGIVPDVIVTEPLWSTVDRMLRERDLGWEMLAEYVYAAATAVAEGKATPREAARMVAETLEIMPAEEGPFLDLMEQQIELESTVMRDGSRAARILEAKKSASVQTAVESLRCLLATKDPASPAGRHGCQPYSSPDRVAS